MKLSIRWKLILSIGLPVLGIYLIVLAVDYQHLKAASYQQTQVYLIERVQRFAELLNSEFSTTAQVAKSTASFMTAHPEISKEDIYSILEANVRENPIVYGSAMAFEPYLYDSQKKLFSPYVARDRAEDLSGVQITLRPMDIGQDGYNYLEWEWYAKIRETGKAFWTEPYYDEGAGNIKMTTFSAPFYRDGKLWGVTTIDIHLEKIQEWGEQKGLSKRSFVVMAPDGRFLSHPRPDWIMEKTFFSATHLQQRPDLEAFGKRALSQKAGVELIQGYPFQSASFVGYARISSTGWILGIAVPESKVMTPVWEQLGRFLAFMMLSLAVIVLILLIASFRITRPLRRLSATVQKISSGCLECDQNEKFPNDEIGQLAGAFQKMVGDLKNYIRQLTEQTAVREAVESELRIAREIQSSLLPHTFPAFPDRAEFDLHAINVPARMVAGDFYDFFFVSEEELVLVIGDVSGKGVPAAIFMVIARTIVRNFAPETEGPGELMQKVNQILCESNEHSLFITLMIAYYNTETGRFRYSNGGHHVPYVTQPTGRTELFGNVTGTIAGVFKEVVYQESVLSLEPGNSLMFYTDGVVEARSPEKEFFGVTRFETILQNQAAAPVSTISQRVMEEVCNFQNHELADDVTVMVLKRTSG